MIVKNRELERVLTLSRAGFSGKRMERTCVRVSVMAVLVVPPSSLHELHLVERVFFVISGVSFWLLFVVFPERGRLFLVSGGLAQGRKLYDSSEGAIMV